MPRTKSKGRGPPPTKDIFASQDHQNELELFRNDLKLASEDKIWTCDETEVPALRQKLDDGRFHRVLASYQDNITKKVKPSGRQPWRVARVLLGLCAIRLGCKVPDGFLKFIKDNRHTCGFDKSVKTQIGNACDSYKEGSFYDFSVPQSSPAQSNVKTQKAASQDEDDTIVVAPAAEDAQDDDNDVKSEDESNEKVPTPKVEENASPEPDIPKRRTSPRSGPRPSLAPKGAVKVSHLTAAGCAVCGSTGYGDGCPLLVCGGCKEVIYCSAECQRKHWKQYHESQCLGPVALKISRSRDATTNSPTPAVNGTKRKAAPKKQTGRASKRIKVEG